MTESLERLRKSPKKEGRRKEKQSESTQSWVPINDVNYEMIETKDGRFVRILEVGAIAFHLRTEIDKRNIIQNFRSWLKQSPVSFQILITNVPTEINDYVRNIEKKMISERNPLALQQKRNYIRQIQRVGRRDSLHKKFYLVLEYNPSDVEERARSKREIGQILLEAAQRAEIYFKRQGNIIYKHDDENLFQLDVLYRFFNPYSSQFESVEQRIERIYMDTLNVNGLVAGKDANPAIHVSDFIAPRGFDNGYYDCVLMDGMYHSSIYVRDNGLPEKVYGGWLDMLTNFGEGVNVSMKLCRQNSERVVPDVERRIRTKSPVLRQAQRDRNNDKAELLTREVGTNRYIAKAMNEYGEDLYYVSVIITFRSHDYAVMKKKKQNVMRELQRVKDISVQDCSPRQEEALLMSMPINYVCKEIFEKCKRNMLTSSIASSYPFTSFELFDPNGIFVGLNKVNSSLVCLNVFNTNMFENANGIIMGISGAGKTFTELLMGYHMRLSGQSVYYILPVKGHEYKRACQAIGGAYIKLGPGSEHCINIMEIRPVKDIDENLIDKEAYKQDSLLTKKITQIQTFIELLLVGESLTTVERNLIDSYLIQLYGEYGICTEDNDSIFSDPLKRTLKKMPIIEDFVNIIKKDANMTRVSTCLETFVTGSCKNMNGQTNIDFSNKYMVFDINKTTIPKALHPAFLFIAIDSCYDLIKQSRTEQSVLFLDEVWQMMVNEFSAEFVMEIFKLIRGYGGSCIAATQDIDDFLSFMEGKYGKAIIRAAKMKIILKLDENGAAAVQDALKLNSFELENIMNYDRGTGMLIANKDRVPISFIASPEEEELFTTDPNRLREIIEWKKKREQHVS